MHVSVAANETVDTSDGQTHHIMIIQEDQLDASAYHQIITTDVSKTDQLVKNVYNGSYCSHVYSHIGRSGRAFTLCLKGNRFLTHPEIGTLSFLINLKLNL